ncbi:TadE/TadG family type IV pilus assembly protein [Novosphingopyxis sp.]|uniref:TadE/TadG family type IV pilus assembly protein n=1 Tax=Novosphingopyxis sp. TaxID=2709690 RepID=UPI003B5BBE10
MMRFRQLLAHDERGATIIEFAIIAPTFLLLLIGTFDLGHQVYLRAVLNGAIQQASRASALETGPSNIAAIDAEVSSQVKRIVPDGVVAFTRKSYFSYNDVKRAETLADANGNGTCDNNEAYEDENNNLKWDLDIGAAGAGNARDVVVYNVSVSYDQLFPLWALLGTSQRKTVSAETILKNQPYGKQGTKTIVSRTCS